MPELSPSLINSAWPSWLGGALLCVLGAVLGAALFWLSAALASLARACAWPLSGGLTTASAVLTACALWLPGLVLSPVLEGRSNALTGVVSSLALPGLISAALQLAGWWLIRKKNWAVLALLPALLLLSALYAKHNLLLAWPEASVLALVISGGLLLLHVPQVSRMKYHQVARILAVLMAASAVTWAVMRAISQPQPQMPGGTALPLPLPLPLLAMAALVVLALIMMASLLLFVMRRIPLHEVGLAHDSHRRPVATDSLTQLPTRSYFEKRLEAAAAKCDSRQRRLALLFIDLDGFKPVNDNFGHGHGDSVLQQVGKRLRVLARSGHVAARVGGDEFLLLMRNVESQEDVSLLAKRLIKHLSLPYQVDHQEVSISCSVGIVLYPDVAGRSKLIARADAAMYAAKRAGGACFCFYTPAMEADAEEKFELLRGLREAVALQQFELYYQPKIDARTGKITAAEALVRWQHPTRGLVLPGLFIPVAERFGLMGALGNWVIEDVCRQAREWRDQGLRMRVAINLSAIQMRQEDIAERIADALKRYRIDPQLLTCEITESAAMEDTRTTQVTLRRLGELGVHISIDDFGTGYSSLSYLRQLPAEELKIDRSFVVDIENSADARSVVDAVVKLAHALGLKVVAEGVENLRQQELLVELGCDELQGYLFARPMTARALLMSSQDTYAELAAFHSSLFGSSQFGSSQARDTV